MLIYYVLDILIYHAIYALSTCNLMLITQFNDKPTLPKHMLLVSFK